jgi:hypothetical protein
MFSCTKQLERTVQNGNFLFVILDFQLTLKERRNGFKIYIGKIGNQGAIADCVRIILRKSALSELGKLSNFEMMLFQLVSKASQNI